MLGLVALGGPWHWFVRNFVHTDQHSWVWWSFVRRNLARGREFSIPDRVIEHLGLTLLAVGIGLVVSVPLAVAVRRWRWLEQPVLWVTGAIFTIPSLALFALLVPVTGLSTTTAEIGLVGYTLLILVRNTLAGLDGVPADVLEAADAMGLSRVRRLVRVELPLALPAIIAGIRIATVTTIGLVTVTLFVGQGGLGQLIDDGFHRQFPTQVTVGTVGCVVLAVAADVTLLGAERLFTPWSRARAAR
jgi:osmoprotectant transport system permease protein